MAWVLAKPYVMTVIIGAKTVEQLTDNLSAVDLTLTADEIRKLDEVSALPEEYPAWMFKRQSSGRVPEPFVPAKS